ncbi:hypothetical protein CMO89_02030 [Candidatus Woesearchaeota archaeon]|nr:hypothetical protein [Candidatus Woesearchaeota archaeon]|tara:strand:+ start:15295 stop:15618 length:324 start_codon:yes stop_codon:yes gene_type:complete
MQRGRPSRSKIRENITEILYFLKDGYGYDIYKAYLAIFPKVTLRSIYYHLKKGVELEEFKIKKIAPEQGSYSWGASVERTYYSLGPNAKPIGDIKVKNFVDKNHKEK